MNRFTAASSHPSLARPAAARQPAAWATLVMLLGLTACGPGADPSQLATEARAGAQTTTNDPEAASAAGLEIDAETEARSALAQAASLGARKVAFQVGTRLGAYGQALTQDGWAFQAVSGDALPAGRDAVVIVNVDAMPSDLDALQQRLRAFNGVIVVDSDRRIEPVADLALDATHSEQADAAGAAMLQQSATAPLHRPSASARVLAHGAGAAYEVEVSASGAVNGLASARREFSSVNLLFTVAHNLRAGDLAAVSGRASALSAHGEGHGEGQASAARARVSAITPLGGTPSGPPPAGKAYLYKAPNFPLWSIDSITPRPLTAAETSSIDRAKALMLGLNAVQTAEVTKAVFAERNLNGGSGITHTGKPAEAVNLLRGGGVARLVEYSRYRSFTDPDLIWLRGLLSSSEVGYFDYLKNTHLSNCNSLWSLRDRWYSLYVGQSRYITAYRNAKAAGGSIPAQVRTNYNNAKTVLNPIYDQYVVPAQRAESTRATLEGINWRMNAIHVNFSRILDREVAAVIREGARELEFPQPVQMPFRLVD